MVLITNLATNLRYSGLFLTIKLLNMDQNFNMNGILDCFKLVLEPQSGIDIIQLKMIRDIEINGNSLNFNIHVPNAKYEFKEQLYFNIIEKFQAQYPQLSVNGHFIVKSSSSEMPNSVVPQIKNFIAVASGKGGVGKSTVSANIAINLSNLGFRVGLLDADLYGPSIPTMFGIQGLRPKVEAESGRHKLVPIQVKNLSLISLGNIIESEQAVVLRGPRLAAIIKQFFQETAWPELDYLIIDLPPGTGDIQLTLVQTIPLTGVVMVTTPQQVAVIDAIKAANMFAMEQINVPILGIVENMAFFSPPDMPEKKYFIFGQNGGKRLADYTKSTLLGQLPIIEDIRARSDNEKSIFESDASSIEFMKICNQLILKIEERNKLFAPTKMVNVE
jgi:ATP-binding protein involved in chromosome partitioning